MNQKTPKDTMRTAATGTTMAGIKVPRLFDEDDLAAAVDVSADAELVVAAEVATLLLAFVSETPNEDSCAESVTVTVTALVVAKVEAGCVTVSSNERIIVVRAEFEPPSAVITVGVAAGPSVPIGPVILVGVPPSCGSLFMLCILACPIISSVAKSRGRYLQWSSCTLSTGGSSSSGTRNGSNLKMMRAESPIKLEH